LLTGQSRVPSPAGLRPGALRLARNGERPKNRAETLSLRDTSGMAKSREQKEPELQVYPMELQLGQLLADERSDWKVIGRPYSTAAGKTVHVRVESMKNPGVTEIRSWGAHERVSVKRE
jgi:hypothetical protein